MSPCIVPSAGNSRQTAPLDPLDEAEIDRDRILPPIDESDPEWQAYVREKIRKSLDDPRPSIPIEEASHASTRASPSYKAKHSV